MRQFITLILICFTFTVRASSFVSGTFEATDSCPAYLSKNTKSNPDNITLKINQRYPIKEINKNPPDWLRIQIPNNKNALRWVSTSCGITELDEKNSSGCDSGSGMADSYVLALSSQSGFCETYGYEAGKPECAKLSKNAYAASHLTLHGLWPNQESCGQRYGFCGVKALPNHCDYTPLNLSTSVATNLKKIMPSYNYGSCLERHEWNKHGTCQVLPVDDYFTLAMRLATEVDQSTFGKFLTSHRGDSVKLSSIRKALDTAFGTENSGKIYLGCKNGVLLDIFIVLPALLPFNESVTLLINKAPAYSYADACPTNVIISNFSKESWY